LGGLKQRRAISLLALRANTPVPVRELVTAIWCVDTHIADVIDPLRVYISQLRALLEPGRNRGSIGSRIVRRGAGYQLQVGLEEVDVLRFSHYVTTGRRCAAEGQLVEAAADLRASESLWQGDPFPELADVATVQPDLARLSELHLSAVEDRVDAEMALGRHVDLASELVALTGTYPLRERLHGQLMLARYRDGRQADALDVYRRLRTTLMDELGVDPAPFLQELERSILRQEPALGPAVLAAEPCIRRRHTIAAAPNALIGRDSELSELVAALQPGANRLLTLCGLGGVGKTRLALAAAAAAGESRTAGACFVSLAGLRDPALAPQAIAEALGIVDVDDDPLAAVVAYLADRDALLVLDSLEHLPGAVPLLGHVLATAPQVTLLVTSRAVLRMCGETVYSVRPLEVPVDTFRSEGPGERSASVDLFCARARAVRPDFDLTEQDAAAVEEICRRLDGVPLAIELAAARARVLSPASILRRLSPRLALLTGGPVDAPDRQRTLRATLRWSYDLLDDTQRKLLAALSVFRGGFRVEAAECVCDLGSDAAESLLDALDALVRHSLVQQTVAADGELRFGLLETVREFAAEQVDPAARQELRDRHATYYLRAVRSAVDQLEGGGMSEAGSRWLAAERNNIRSALGWTLRSDQGEAGPRLLLAVAKLRADLGGHPLASRSERAGS
jgi:predicted ATPase/DNA-binding SARP family transcriptional activator